MSVPQYATLVPTSSAASTLTIMSEYKWFYAEPGSFFSDSVWVLSRCGQRNSLRLIYFMTIGRERPGGARLGSLLC